MPAANPARTRKRLHSADRDAEQRRRFLARESSTKGAWFPMELDFLHSRCGHYTSQLCGEFYPTTNNLGRDLAEFLETLGEHDTTREIGKHRVIPILIDLDLEGVTRLERLFKR